MIGPFGNIDERVVTFLCGMIESAVFIETCIKKRSRLQDVIWKRSAVIGFFIYKLRYICLKVVESRKLNVILFMFTIDNDIKDSDTLFYYLVFALK